MIFVHNPSQALRRELGIFGAIMLGLGSILGTGVFVSISFAIPMTGPATILAIAVAAAVATCNGLSSAQLAANHAVSGGTYEYGYRWLRPELGFLAGWMFLCAKSASAATAALGFSGYALHSAGLDVVTYLTPVSLITVVALTILVLSGLRRSNRANSIIVCMTLTALLIFVLAGLPAAIRSGMQHLKPFFNPTSEPATWFGFFEASAFMFVAYTGYGRIATMSEEIRNPQKNIPRAMIGTLTVSMLIYTSVAYVGIASLGADQFGLDHSKPVAPLERVAGQFSQRGIQGVVCVGAMTAMIGVLLNLILGLSRVVLAMGRRGDLPPVLAKLNRQGTTPYLAVILVAILIGGLVFVGDPKTTWSFSAFTVLIYYSLTNAAALRLSKAERLYSPIVSWIGLLACLFLAFCIETKIWLLGSALLLLGLLWHAVAKRLTRRRSAKDMGV